jgi:predicted phage terminase large subunit-like protein
MIGVWLSHAQRNGKNARGIWFRRTFPELEEAERVMAEIFLPLGAVWSVGRRTWTFPNGATLKLRFLERDKDADKYQGHSYTIAFFDELGTWESPDPVDKIRATLRSAEGVRTQIIASGNPGGLGHEWIKKRYILPAPPLTPFQDITTGTHRVFIPSRLEDNPALMKNDPTYIDRLRASGPAYLVRAWLKGDWNAAPDGGIIKISWFGRYRIPPDRFLRTLQSWDTASKGKDVNDYSVCTTWGETLTGIYLLDVFRKRMEYPELKRAAKSLAARWNPNELVIEDKGSGISLIQDLRAETRLPVIAIEPEGDKVLRASTESPAIEAGRVFLPEEASWLMDYEGEVGQFPLAGNDDQMDSTSQALKRFRISSAGIVIKSAQSRATMKTKGF